MAQLLVWRALFIVILALQVKSNSIGRRKRSEDRCPKLEFYEESRSHCIPCSLCAEDTNPTYKRDECVEKHPDSIPHQGNMGPWCDEASNHGTFPECPPIDESLETSCSPNCRNRRRKFAPGCVCEVGCPGKSKIHVKCTRDLQWNNSIPTECDALTTASTVTETVISASLPRLQDSQTTGNVIFENKDDSMTVVIITCVFALIIIIMVLIVAVVYFGRKRCRGSGNQCNNCKWSDASSNESGKTRTALLPSQPFSNGIVSPAENGKSANHGFLTKNVPEVKEVTISSEQHQPLESDALLKRENGRRVVDVRDIVVPSVDPAMESEGAVANSKEERQSNAVTATNSQEALSALLKNRSALSELCKLFDQRDRFEKITWHTIATQFAGWDKERVRSLEYLMNPAASNGVPGDGPTFKVLRDVDQKKTRGLLELVVFLQRHPYPRKEAVDILQDFWAKWKSEHYIGNPHC